MNFWQCVDLFRGRCNLKKMRLRQKYYCILELRKTFAGLPRVKKDISSVNHLLSKILFKNLGFRTISILSRDIHLKCRDKRMMCLENGLCLC